MQTALIENVAREQLNPVDEARACATIRGKSRCREGVSITLVSQSRMRHCARPTRRSAWCPETSRFWDVSPRFP